jgi:hypothetical protein
MNHADDLHWFYLKDNVELMDVKNRIVLPAQWRDSLIHRYNSTGRDPVSNPAHRHVALSAMRDAKNRPYLELIDNVWFGEHHAEVLKGDGGFNPVTLETLSLDDQWRITVPARMLRESGLERVKDTEGRSKISSRYVYLVGNPARDRQTIMIWGMDQALAAGYLTEAEIEGKRASKSGRKGPEPQTS